MLLLGEPTGVIDVSTVTGVTRVDLSWTVPMVLPNYPSLKGHHTANWNFFWEAFLSLTYK